MRVLPREVSVHMGDNTEVIDKLLLRFQEALYAFCQVGLYIYMSQ